MRLQCRANRRFPSKAEKRKASLSRGRKVLFPRRGLNAERRPASARALHVRIVKLETGGFEGFDIIYNAALKVHKRRRVNEHLEFIKIEDFVHHSGSVFEVHRIAESRAASTDYSDAETCRHRILLRHDFLHLSHSGGR